MKKFLLALQLELMKMAFAVLLIFGFWFLVFSILQHGWRQS